MLCPLETRARASLSHAWRRPSATPRQHKQARLNPLTCQSTDGGGRTSKGVRVPHHVACNPSSHGAKVKHTTQGAPGYHVRPLMPASAGGDRHRSSLASRREGRVRQAEESGEVCGGACKVNRRVHRRGWGRGEEAYGGVTDGSRVLQLPADELRVQASHVEDGRVSPARATSESVTASSGTLACRRRGCQGLEASFQ